MSNLVVEPAGVLLPAGWVGAFELPSLELDISGDQALAPPGHLTFTTTLTPQGDPTNLLVYLIEQNNMSGRRRLAVYPDHPLNAAAVAMAHDFRVGHQLIEVGDGDYKAMLKALLQPIEEEFQLKLSPGRVGRKTSDGLTQLTMAMGYLASSATSLVQEGGESSLDSQLIVIHSSLAQLLLGAIHRLEVDIPLEQTRAAIRYVLQRAKHHKTRGVLTSLHGILSAYQLRSAETLYLLPTPQAARDLHNLVDSLSTSADATDLSLSRFKLGLPNSVANGLKEMSKFAGRLLARHEVAKACHLVKCQLFVGTRRPPRFQTSRADADRLSALEPLAAGFLPPIVPGQVQVPKDPMWMAYQIEAESRRLGLSTEIASAIQRRLVPSGSCDTPALNSAVSTSDDLGCYRGERNSICSGLGPFEVALSFPGNVREQVEPLATLLAQHLGEERVFYDRFYIALLSRPNLDVLLQDIYGKRSKLLVVFIGLGYQEREWCGIEWRAIRDIIKSREDARVMFVRTDDAKVDGILSIDGYVDLRATTTDVLATLVRARLKSLQE